MKTHQGRIRQQKKRRAGVKRIEFVLNPGYLEDEAMIAYLDAMVGRKSDYIREAVAQHMDRDRNPEPSLSDVFGGMMEAIADLAETVENRRMSELDDLRRENAELRRQLAELQNRTFTVEAAAVRVTMNAPTDNSTVQSGGIDMGRPRPKAAKRIAPVEAEPEEWTDEDAQRMGYIMAMSIKNAKIGKG